MPLSTRRAMRPATRLVVAALLLAAAWVLPGVRRHYIADATTWDATPSPPAKLPGGSGPGLPPAPRVRVVLIDGLAAKTARTLPTWTALCKRGVTLTVDVGFPTISLPVEAALWSGLTQQQTGIVFRSDRPLDPPLRGIPSQVPGSRAIAENHGYIVRSLGFAQVESDDPEWQAHALEAVASDARLVFVHVLRVDTAGHKHGRDSAEYRKVAGEADAIVATLVDAAPDARWFLLSDHGHLAGGGHGGEELDVRQVEHCIFGPGIAPARGELVHVVDVARALADSVGVTLDKASLGRPLSVALAAPLGPDQAIPATALGPGVAAIFLIVVGGVVAAWGVRRWWLAPWWFIAACVSLVVIRGMPTLSTPMVYAPTGRAMWLCWLPALALCAVTAWLGLARQPVLRVLASQLALPVGVVVAALTVTRGWPVLVAAHVAPVVPRFTAWASPLILIAAHGLGVVGLVVLGTSVRSAFDRRRPPEPPRSEPAAG
jgi:hypothetical protein